MKFKITVLFAALMMLADIMSAGPIIILQGGSRRGTYNYVYYSDTKIVCRGAGNEICPAGWYSALYGPVSVPVNEIIDYVFKVVESGEKSGEIKFKDAIPVQWEVTGDDEVQIKIDGDFKEMAHD